MLPLIDSGVENVAKPSASTPSYFKIRASLPIAGFKCLLTPQLELKKYLFIVLAAVISLFSSCAEDDAAIGLSGLKVSAENVILLSP